MRQWFLALILVVAGIAVFLPRQFWAGEPLFSGPGPSSQQAFDRWVEDQPRRAEAYDQLRRFLDAEGVGDVVPVWQLLRVDGNYASLCDAEYFVIPPRELWDNIVPALRLVRDEVQPTIGEVEVVSAWRSPGINDCVNGASRSRHLRFEAVDLVAPDQDDREAFFTTLCQLHGDRGVATRMGLGAYFDPSDPDRNRRARFHIDASGFRGWGFDYTSASNPCPTLLAP